MTDENRTFDTELIERVTQHACLHVYSDVLMMRPLAVTMAGTIESDGLITSRERAVKSDPVFAGTGVTVNQDDGTAGAFDYEVQARTVDGHKFRDGLRMMMRNARADVMLFKWAGDSHQNSLFMQTRRGAKLQNQPSPH